MLPTSGHKEKPAKPFGSTGFTMVETVGIEPMTSCMSSMRSNQLSYASATQDIIAYAEAFVKGFWESFLIFFRFFGGFGSVSDGDILRNDPILVHDRREGYKLRIHVGIPKLLRFLAVFIVFI